MARVLAIRWRGRERGAAGGSEERRRSRPRLPLHRAAAALALGLGAAASCSSGGDSPGGSQGGAPHPGTGGSASGTGGSASGTGGSGTSGRTGCQLTCADLGAECGLAQPPNCQLVVKECGRCPESMMCGADGVPNKCGAAGTWSVFAAPSSNPIGIETINALWGSGPRDVWALDNYGQVLQWVGGASFEVAVRTGLRLKCLHGTSSANFWVAGERGVVYRRMGTALAALPRMDNPNNIAGIWVAGPDEAWLAHQYGILHYAAGQWVRADEYNEAGFSAIWGASPTDVWAVGEGGIVHRVGGAWKVVYPKSDRVRWRGIWGADANNVWAVGSNIGRWDGTEFRTLNLAEVPGSLLAVWGASKTDIWAVGGVALGSGSLIMHGDGYDFQAVRSPTQEVLGSVWGSGPRDVWAAGSAGVILRYAK